MNCGFCKGTAFSYQTKTIASKQRKWIYCSSCGAVLAVVTALLQRERTGEGIILDVAMQDSLLPALATIIGAYYYHNKEVAASGFATSHKARTWRRC